MRETDHRRLVAALAQRKHAEQALWALVGLPRMEPVEYYLSVLTDVHHVAHHGVIRPSLGSALDETGRRAQVLSPTTPGTSRFTAATPKGESRPPAYDPRAQGLLRGMMRELDKEATKALNALDAIVGESEAA